MRVKCGTCKQLIVFDANKLNLDFPQIKCPKCKATNKLILSEKQKQAIKQKPLPKPKEITVFGAILVVETDGPPSQLFELRKGINTIGRLSSSFQADVAVETADMRMSRKHALIEVFKIKDRNNWGFVLCNFENKTPIQLNDDCKMSFLDEIYLKNGDKIKIGNSILIFNVAKDVRNIVQVEGTLIERR